MAELNEISVVIGELRSDAKSTREALSRVEDRLDQISHQLTALPSPQPCVKKHSDIERELRDIRIENAKHATIISGFVAGIVLFGKQLLMAVGVVLPR